MRFVLRILAAAFLLSQRASASEVFELQPDMTYVATGPFADNGGYLLVDLSFSGSPGPDFSLLPLNYPFDQAAVVESITVNGIVLQDGYSTNPGPNGILQGGFISLTAQDPTLIISSVSGYVLYYSSSTGLFGSSLIDPTGSVTITLENDYAGPFSISHVPEPSTWAMLMIGLAGVGWLSRRRNRNVFLR